MASVYLITNLSNGKYYVGKTRYSLARRFRQHVTAANTSKRDRNRYLLRAIRKYGAQAFTAEVLSAGIHEDEVGKCEMAWIALLSATGRTVGYNISGGGDGFNDPTGEIRRKISATLTGRKVPKEVTARSVRAQQQTCKNGHSLSGYNLKPNSHGRRVCRTCNVQKTKESCARSRIKFEAAGLTREGKIRIEPRVANQRRSESAKRRWASENNCSGSLEALASGRKIGRWAKREISYEESVAV